MLKLRKLTLRYSRECRTTVLKQQASIEEAMLLCLTQTRSCSLPILPRDDNLPPSFRAQREHVISETAQRSISLGSPGSSMDYSPNSKLRYCTDIKKIGD